MMDISPTIVAKSDQMNADDLIDRTVTIRITRVNVKADEQPVSISYEGDGGKPYKPGKSMRRVLAHAWGKDATVWAGRSLTLYRDPSIRFGGLAVGGIRISHMSDISGPLTIALTETRGSKKAFTVKPLKVEQQQAKPTQVDTALVKAGDGAAAWGSEAFRVWWQNLTKEQRATLGTERKDAWKAEAAKHDPYETDGDDDFPGDRAPSEQEAL